MRLIDADKLMESLNPKESVWVGLVLSELIENAPTVKAIPIEWLKKKCNEADNMGMSIDDWSVKDCYELVLEDWECRYGR